MSSSTRVLRALLPSRKWRIRSLMPAVTFAACVLCTAGASPSNSATPDGAASVDQAVRAFMQTVSHSVTQDGPLAWIKYFDASPAFFMAVNGQMAFPNSAAAQEGTRKFAQTIRHIELKWGDDLRRSAHQRVRRGRGLVARDPSRHRRAQRYRNGILYRTCGVSRGTMAVPRRSLVITRFLSLVPQIN